MNQTNSGPTRLALKVSRKEYLTPHFIRVYLHGEDVHQFADMSIGANNKILIPPPGVDKVHFPEFDEASGKWLDPSDDIRPIVRTYTHRGIDLSSNEIWIDFVAHGDEGPASEWAINAKAGDALGVMMKNKKSDLYPPADNYVLVGDATAIPVLGAILETLPASAKGICIIEVHGKADEQIIDTQADIDFMWLHNDNPQQGSELANVLKTQTLPTENRFAYVAAEFETVKTIRSYLRKEQDWDKREVYAFSYWKAGTAEDESARTRRKEMLDGEES